ncbi:MAG: hypothetical protein KAQ71_19735 [Desulfobulbaceae bacterium]|nr:hypothetical protein [Desulfobulbaceae bacterium]
MAKVNQLAIPSILEGYGMIKKSKKTSTDLVTLQPVNGIQPINTIPVLPADSVDESPC